MTSVHLEKSANGRIFTLEVGPLNYVFADFELDSDRAELRRGGEPVRVEPQVFDLLKLLVSARDRVVTRDEIFEVIWGNRIVSDAALSSRIRDARKVLGDIMASVQIAFAQTARIGDAIRYDGQWCYVEKIGFTHLRLRTWDERRLIAPVSDFTSDSFENWTKQESRLMMHVELEFDNRADVEALRQPFREFVENDEDVVDPEDAKCQVIAQNAQAMTVRLMARPTDPKSARDTHCRLREHMLRAASEMDAAAEREPVPAYLPREREVRMDLTAAEEA